MTNNPCILWLTPDKPENISIGRQRIADHLQEAGLDVTLRGTTPRTLLTSIHERDQYDIVVGTTRSGAIAGAVLTLLGGPPLVVDHIDPIRQFAKNNSKWIIHAARTLESLSFVAANHVLYVYEEERPRVKRYAGSFSKTDLGIEYDWFAEPSAEAIQAADDALADLDLREQVAIYIGGLEPIYNVEAMVESAAHLDDWSLVVLGTGSLESTVRQAAAEQDNIHFLGTVPHEVVPGYLHRADVGISLVDDPHTLKVLEYDAAGLAVVQTKGRAESRFGDRVKYTKSRKPDEIAEAVRCAGTQTDGYRNESFAKAYDWTVIADQYREVLQSFVPSR